MLPYHNVSQAVGLGGRLEVGRGVSKIRTSFSDKCDTRSYTTIQVTSYRTCYFIQGGSNMTGTDLCVNKPHCAAAVRP